MKKCYNTAPTLELPIAVTQRLIVHIHENISSIRLLALISRKGNYMSCRLLNYKIDPSNKTLTSLSIVIHVSRRDYDTPIKYCKLIKDDVQIDIPVKVSVSERERQ